MTANTNQQATLAQMQNMVNRVIINGREVFVVVPNIKQFKVEAVEKLTVRPNKRRTPEKRFHWLLHAFIRQTQPVHGKHINVRLLAATDKDTLFRNEKGIFVTMEKLVDQPDLAALA